MYKRDLINFLFVLGFPMYGIGNYVSAVVSPVAGYYVSVIAYLLIIIFYSIDLAYRREFTLRINPWFAAGIAIILLNIISLFRSLYKGLPEEYLLMTISKSVMLASPFLAFVIVRIYNRSDASIVPRLAFRSLTILILINIAGLFILGLSNGAHSIEDRLSFPFLDGFYNGACILAILNLMIIDYIVKASKQPVRLTWLISYFLMNAALLFLINSRISILIFVLVAILLAFRLLDKMRGMFVASLFTIPVLLSSGILLYEILSMPVFASVLQRVDVQDVTTFNGRSYIWQNALDWLLYDRRGILFGNGYRGHYFLDLISDVARMWNEKDLYHMHLHSTSLELLTSQGLFAFAIFCAVVYKTLVHYRVEYTKGQPGGVFFGVVVFLLFILQVDAFLYLESSGAAIFALLFSDVVVK